MGKSKDKRDAQPEDEAVIMERLKQGFKQLLNTPPETHREMIERRRGDRPAGKKPKRISPRQGG
jgi:hypothetical protein